MCLFQIILRKQLLQIIMFLKHTHTNKQILSFFQYTYIPVKFVFAIWPRKHVLDCNKHDMQHNSSKILDSSPQTEIEIWQVMSIINQTTDLSNRNPQKFECQTRSPPKKPSALAPEKRLFWNGRIQRPHIPYILSHRNISVVGLVVGKDCVTAMEDKTRIRNAKKTAGKLQLSRKI